MGQYILLTQKEFDEAFEATLNKLKADRYSHPMSPDHAKFDNSPVGAMHLTFHYEVCRLKSRLEGK
jgi:hypothetical protein